MKKVIQKALRDLEKHYFIESNQLRKRWLLERMHNAIDLGDDIHAELGITTHNNMESVWKFSERHHTDHKT